MEFRSQLKFDYIKQKKRALSLVEASRKATFEDLTGIHDMNNEQ